MSSPGAAPADCLVCRQVGGDLPGGLLIDAPLVAAFHAEPVDTERVLLGHVLVSPRRHVAGLADLDAREAAALGVAVTRVARAVRATLEPERIYSAVVGHHVPHLHVHVLPRHRGTPPELEWTAIDEWAGAPLGGAGDVSALAERLRAALA